MFRRPCLIHSWTELAVWLSWPLGLGMAAIAALVIGPAEARWSAAAMLAGTIGAVVAKFLPRWRDMGQVFYRTKHGVAVILRHGWLHRFEVEKAIDRAVAAFGNRERLDGVALYVVKGPLFVRGQRVRGVFDVDATVAWDDLDSDGVLAVITHEFSHVLIDSHPDAEHAEMARQGTL